MGLGSVRFFWEVSRYAHHEQQRSATDPSDTFFNENAERLRREDEERREKNNDRDRER